MARSWRYDEHTWPEIKARILEQPVVVLPIGAVEDHGLHMALNTDNVILEGIIHAAARRAPDDMIVLPTIPYGFDEHHMDFPGTISIGLHTLIDFASDVAISVACHGFTHILIANGHGSNHPICDLVARNVVIATGVICASMSPNAAVDPTLAQDVILAERRSGAGGIAHACEYETSMMLYLRPDLVDMALAEADRGQLRLKYFNWDHGEQRAELARLVEPLLPEWRGGRPHRCHGRFWRTLFRRDGRTIHRVGARIPRHPNQTPHRSPLMPRILIQHVSNIRHLRRR